MGAFYKYPRLRTALYLPLTIQSLQQTVLDEKNPFGGLAPGRARLKNVAASMLILQSFPRKDIVKTAITCLHLPPHPSPRDTFSPRAKVFDGCAIKKLIRLPTTKLQWAKRRSAPSQLSSPPFSNATSTRFHLAGCSCSVGTGDDLRVDNFATRNLVRSIIPNIATTSHTTKIFAASVTGTM